MASTVAEARGQARRFEVGARPEHRFGAVETDRLDADAHLAALRIIDREITEASPPGSPVR